MIRLRELRLERNLTQRELAVQTRSTDKSIWAYEKGIAVPPLDVLIKFANFFECSIDYLAGRSDDLGVISIESEKPALTKDEQQLLETYRALNEKNRMRVSAYTSVRLEEHTAENPIKLKR